MKKKLLGLAVGLGAVALGAVSLTSCTNKDVFHIYAWNDEFQLFFEHYSSDEKVPSKVDGKANPEAPKVYHYKGKEVKWTIVPSEGGAYQQALDEALKNNEKASGDKKVDMFLAEADYIVKYTNSDRTQDVKPLGVTDVSNTYQYTVQAASSKEGVMKGVSFQCCPSALIYRRSIAKDVFGTEDPDEVQNHVDTWEHYEATAAALKEKNYYVTASFAESYRPFSSNVSKPWVAADGTIQIDDNITKWMDQQEDFVKKGYVLNTCPDIWGGGKNEQMYNTGKTFSFFGPAWYYNFCMGNALDKEKGTNGDWAVCEGPQAHFWGGTWLLAATGADHTDLVANVMNDFLSKEISDKLIANDNQFTNNKLSNEQAAADPNRKNTFLGGQNDTALFVNLAKNIRFENNTVYDQLANEKIQEYYSTYLKYIGGVEGFTATTRAAQLDLFYDWMVEKYPDLKKPTK